MSNSAQKKIFISSDHAGFALKKFLTEELLKLGYVPVDLGCNSPDKSVDYPDYATKLCKKLGNQFGILICGSGVGISIAANRYKKIRAALCHNTKIAKLSRMHNDANVLCLGARFTKEKLALAITKAFLTTKFEGGRHEARVVKLGK
jgi:ribose 5-phosphate isomerase B